MDHEGLLKAYIWFVIENEIVSYLIHIFRFGFIIIICMCIGILKGVRSEHKLVNLLR